MANQLIRFGRLSLLYEDGFIRYVRAGGIEIIRMIYFALRDSNWVTAGIVRTDERVSVSWKGFEISYTATNVVGGEDVFRWHVKMSGNESGEIEFSVEGEAVASYTRNRAGICVLHPIRDTRNKPVKITRPDATVYDSVFPSVIEPQQPFMDITRMAWQLKGDAWAQLEFEGDVFETEDQRNWSDTSFKTYSTPLAIPYPVTLKPGDKVKQRVKLRLINADALPASDMAEDIEITIHEDEKRELPKIGSEFPGEASKSQKEIGLLKALQFEHLRIEVVVSSPTWREKWRAGIGEAGSLGIKVFAHLIFGTDVNKEWSEFTGALGAQDIQSVSRLAFSPADRKGNVDAILNAVLAKARKLFPGVSIGAGFQSYFTELNRNRFDYSGIDFVIYPANPQVHATDSLTIIENLPVLEDAVKSANTFARNKKVHVGPISIKPRFNPDAKTADNKDQADFRFDERQSKPITAGWALAGIKYLAEGGADSITLFETHGRAGLFSDGHIFPVYDALLAFRKLNPRNVIRTTCNEPLFVTSLLVECEGNKKHLVLINHTALQKSVSVGDVFYTLTDHEIQFIPMSK